jgi:hypothetical protein
MPLTFYPHTEDTQKGSHFDRIEILMEGAERYKAAILDATSSLGANEGNIAKATVPREQQVVYNWEEIARVLREVRELPEANQVEKEKKGKLLLKLAEVYEVLRSAKMPKLEAVRLALISEAGHLGVEP